MRMDQRRRNLGFFFDESVKRLPDKVAVIDLFGGHERCTTYRQLDQRMDAVASMLARLGVRPGERVAMLIGNRTEFLEFFFGAMRAGAIPLPLNTRLAGDTLEQIIRGAGCALPIVDTSSNRGALSIAARVPLRVRLLLGRGEPGFQSFEEELAKGGPAVEPPPITDITQAFQPYTSGSTGRPKGAVMTHRGMLWYVAYNQRYWPSAETDRGLIALPLFHKNALRGTVKPMLYAGGSFVLLRAARLSGRPGEIQMHLLARRRRRVHDVSPASRLSAQPRSQCFARHDDRLGGGDAMRSSGRCLTSRCRRAMA